MLQDDPDAKETRTPQTCFVVIQPSGCMPSQVQSIFAACDVSGHQGHCADASHISGHQGRCDDASHISQYARCRGKVGPEFAIPLLQRMREANIAPDLPTYSKLLDLCSHAAAHRKADIQDVGSIFAQMQYDGLTPNTMTMNAMLKVCARLASHGNACILDGFDMLQWCLDGIALSDPHMIQHQHPDVTSHDDEHREPAYASMEQVLALMEALSSYGQVRPDIVTFNTLVEICAKSALTGAANLQVRKMLPW
jgi:hypothetical protein